MTLLFLHGAGFTHDAFAAQSAAFPHALAPDLPGHCAPGEASSMGDFASFVESYACSRAGGALVICGHSMGAAIALHLALRRNLPLRGLILIGGGARMRVAPAFLEGFERDFEATALQVAGYFFAQSSAQRLDWSVASMRAVGQAQTLRDFRVCDAFDVLERLEEIAVPVLALTGEQDKMTPPKYAQALADRVPAGEARIVPGAGHFVMVEQPEETNRAIAAFLSGIV
jgi:3-oxoadipate enol-lactonase